MKSKKPRLFTKPKRYYGVGAIENKHDIEWADGMIGVIAIFTNKRKAKKYAGKRPLITFMEDK